MTRKCSECRETKSISEFYVRRRDDNGHPVTWRGQCKSCLVEVNRRWEKKRRRSNAPVDREKGCRLDITPFRAWLSERLVVAHGGSVQGLAHELKVDERRLWDWLHNARQVHIDMVDRALLNAGWMLVDVYPELYVFGEEQMDLGVAA